MVKIISKNSEVLIRDDAVIIDKTKNKAIILFGIYQVEISYTSYVQDADIFVFETSELAFNLSTVLIPIFQVEGQKRLVQV